MDTLWIVARGDARFEAPDIATLKTWVAAGNLRADDRLWNPYTRQWIVARDLPELALADTVAVSPAVSAVGQPANVTPPVAKKGLSSGCKSLGIGCLGVIVGIVLTIGAEVWMAAAGIQAVKDALSGGSGGGYPSSTASNAPAAQVDLSQCGMKRGWGLDPEDKDPALKKACDEARRLQMDQDRVNRRLREEEQAKKDGSGD
ncbi:MAG: hypothetical protein QOE68_2116 [Thermoanaerobaculia bacterium]|jgi:hypothetical protein|nr:hypothetical protein [Thermoanaerobaculia bacterium]